MEKRLVVGISGASGAPLAIDLLREMRLHEEWETHLVVTDGARRTIAAETELELCDVEALADVVYDVEDIGAAIASGTFRTEGMVIVPCSMKTLAGVATGYADNLLLRSADVMLKQRRKLVMAVRETPIHGLHLKNMQTVVELGAVVLPPMMTFYIKPRTIEDMTHHITGKILDEFGIECSGFRRWCE